jgi:hypothetical protein
LSIIELIEDLLAFSQKRGAFLELEVYTNLLFALDSVSSSFLESLSNCSLVRSP